MKDVIKTIHLSTQSAKLLKGLKAFIPEGAICVEPFVGEGDLVAEFPLNVFETYDIRDLTKPRDTLKNPPDYKGKFIITNPPYLARNKAEDKEIYDAYQMDDMYKIFIRTMLAAEGGIIIVPVNFLTDERSGSIRTEFFNVFSPLAINYCLSPSFDSTTYSVCAIAFERKEAQEVRNCLIRIVEQDYSEHTFQLERRFGYRLGGDFYNSLASVRVRFSRVVSSNVELSTGLLLTGLDTREGKINLSADQPTYVGKNTDRMRATLSSEQKFSEEQLKLIAQEFNLMLNSARAKYCNLILTNYRDNNRKRIGFDDAYRLASLAADKLKF